MHLRAGHRFRTRLLAARLRLSKAERRAHRAAARSWHLDCDDLLPFDVFAALPPGLLDIRVFDQDTWWVDQMRVPHRIKCPVDFTDAHLAAVIAMLERNCDRYAPTNDDLVAALALPDRASGSYEAWGQAWLESTVLMQALRAEVWRRRLAR